MIWKIPAIYKITKRTNQNSRYAARRQKGDPSFDEILKSTLAASGKARSSDTKKDAAK